MPRTDSITEELRFIEVVDGAQVKFYPEGLGLIATCGTPPRHLNTAIEEILGTMRRTKGVRGGDNVLGINNRVGYVSYRWFVSSTTDGSDWIRCWFGFWFRFRGWCWF